MQPKNDPNHAPCPTKPPIGVFNSEYPPNKWKLVTVEWKNEDSFNYKLELVQQVMLIVIKYWMLKFNATSWDTFTLVSLRLKLN